MHAKSEIYIKSFLAAIIIFYAISVLHPAYWNWSVFVLPGWASVQVAILGLVLILLFVPLLSYFVYEKFTALFRILSSSLGRLPIIVKALLWIGIPFILLYLLRFNTHIYGDSENLIGSIVSGEISSPFYNRIGMLMQLLAKPFNLVRNTRETAADYLAIISVLAGVVFIFFSWKTIQLIIRDRGAVVIAYLAVITSGLIAIFAGYIEAYSIIIAWLSVYIYYAVRYLHGEGKTSILVLLFTVGVFWHFWFIAFFPSLIYVLNRRLKILNRILLIALRFLFVISIYFIGQVVLRGDFPLTIPFLPSDKTNYFLFSPAHFVDIANQVVIIGPVLALLGLILAILYKKENLKDSHKFLLWAGLPALAIAFMIDPHLGAARDWDLLSIFAAPLIILGAVLLQTGERPVLKNLLIVILLFNVLHSGSILAANKNQEYAIDRIISITYDDPHYQESYYGAVRNTPFAVILGNGYHRYSDAIGFLKRLVDAKTATGNDIALLANYCFFSGQYEDAVIHFDSAKKQVTFSPQEWSEYGYSLYFSGQYSRAIEQLRYALVDTCSDKVALCIASSFAHDYQLDSCKKYCDISIACSRDSIQAMHSIVQYLPGWVFPRLKAQYETRVLAAYPDSLEIRNNLIRLFQLAGMTDSVNFYMNYGNSGN